MKLLDVSMSPQGDSWISESVLVPSNLGGVALIPLKWKKSHSQPPVGWCWLKPCRIMGNNGISTTFTSTDEFTGFLNHQLTWQWKMDSDWRCISYWKWGYIYIFHCYVSLPEGNLKSFPTILTSPHFFFQRSWNSWPKILIKQILKKDGWLAKHPQIWIQERISIETLIIKKSYQQILN